jgi:hypothetical protein
MIRASGWCRAAGTLRLTEQVAQGLERHMPGPRDKDFPSGTGM